MSYMYGILAVTGWVWTAIFAVFLIVRLRQQASRLEVQQHEKQP